MNSDSGSSDDGSNKKPLLRKRHVVRRLRLMVLFEAWAVLQKSGFGSFEKA